MALRQLLLITTFILAVPMTVLGGPGQPLVTLSGHIIKISEELKLLAKNNQEYLIVADTPESQKALEQLRHGDLLYAQGFIKEDVALVTNVRFIGLRHLIGLWRTVDNRIYDFKNFHQLTIVAPSWRGRTTQIVPHEVNYQLSPGYGNQWVLHISDEHLILVGTLSLRGRHLKIEITNPQTGNTFSIKLSRIPGPSTHPAETHWQIP